MYYTSNGITANLVGTEKLTKRSLINDSSENNILTSMEAVDQKICIHGNFGYMNKRKIVPEIHRYMMYNLQAPLMLNVM